MALALQSRATELGYRRRAAGPAVTIRLTLYSNWRLKMGGLQGRRCSGGHTGLDVCGHLCGLSHLRTGHVHLQGCTNANTLCSSALGLLAAVNGLRALAERRAERAPHSFHCRRISFYVADGPNGFLSS